MTANSTLEATTLNHFFNKATYAPQSTFSIALLHSNPPNTITPAGLGTYEASYNGYARQNTAPVDWNAPSGDDPAIIDNANVIQYATAGAGANETVTHFAIIYGVGNEMLIGALTSPKTITEGDAPKFDPTQLRATCT